MVLKGHCCKLVSPQTGSSLSYCQKYKLSWDFKIQLDHHIEHNNTDIMLLNKEDKSCIIVDVACPSDTRIISKKREKIDNYSDYCALK